MLGLKTGNEYGKWLVWEDNAYYIYLRSCLTKKSI